MAFLNDDKGNKSYARLAGFLLILSYILWGSYIVYIKNIIPDIPVIIAALITSLYGISKSISNIPFNKIPIEKIKEYILNLSKGK